MTHRLPQGRIFRPGPASRSRGADIRLVKEGSLFMLQLLFQRPAAVSPAASAIFSMAAMLLSGYLMTRITKRLKLPNVTAYIVAGILIGPFCFNLIPASFLEGSQFLPDLALAFIAFSAGEFFRFSALRKNGGKVLIITVLEACMASAAVFVLTSPILHLDPAFSIVLSALASTTAPASTVMTIRQTGARGDFVDTLLQVVALDDIVGLLAYSAAISAAVLSASGGSFHAADILIPLLENLGVFALGGVFGFLMMLMNQKRHSTDNRLIIAVALLFSFCGICTMFDISPLLGCMSMGTVYINLTGDEKLFRQLNYFSPPILLLFFVRSGVSFNLNALVNPSGSVGRVPLLTVGVLYFLTRIAGKYAGAFLGSLLVKKPGKTRNYLGLALIPQAGVAIGLSALGARTLGGETGEALQTIVLASSVLYELIGPACAKLSLYLSGSYSDKLEDLVSVPDTTPEGAAKSQAELLIERIRRIQEELPSHDVSEEELAFTEEAERQYAALMHAKRSHFLQRR